MVGSFNPLSLDTYIAGLVRFQICWLYRGLATGPRQVYRPIKLATAGTLTLGLGRGFVVDMRSTPPKN